MSPFRVSTSKAKLDIAMIHAFLANESTWAAGIPFATVERAIMNSLCFGGYVGSSQVAFARVITDQATFANVVDVFVLTEHRGKGYSKIIMQAVMSHAAMQGVEVRING